jgi:sulfur relay (sulfurtransferase) complex TusBCD TusD component (DsrE family)
MNEKPEGGSKIGILVTSSPESENSRTLIQISEAAINMGQKVRIFLMCDGVYHILYDNFLSLVDKGADVTLCAQNAMERGLEKKPGILFGSQYDLANIMAESDSFLALT